MSTIEALQKKREQAQELLDAALAERGKIRKIARAIPAMRASNKEDIKRFEKLLLDCNCLIEIQNKNQCP